MTKQTYNQQGFHAVGLILAVVVVALIGLIGFKVFNLKDNSKAAGESAAKSQAATQSAATIPVPTGWNIYADAAAGVQFIYPGAYGSFGTRTDFCCNLSLASFPQYESMLTSSTPSTEYLPGVSGYFSLNTYKKGNMKVDSIKYAPKIQLADDQWIVTEPSANNPHGYKPGDVYPEMSSVNTHGLDVYTAKSADQATVNYTLFFVTGGQLRELQLPTFKNGINSATNAIIDETPYDSMYQQIRDSISLY